VARRTFRRLGIESLIIASINDSYSFLRSEAAPRDRKLTRAIANRYLEFNERRSLRGADLIDVVSSADVGWLAKLDPSLLVRVVPLGVRPEWRSEIPSDGNEVLERDIVLFSRGPGLREYLRDVHPVVASRIPKVRASIVGPEPDAEILRIAESLGIDYLGFVEDVHRVVKESGILVAPSQQRCGSSNRAMLGMSTGTAVVGGRCLQSLDGALAGRDYMLAWNSVEMSEKICQLVLDPSMRQAVAARGKSYIAGAMSAEEVSRSYWQSVIDWAVRP
jgi:hypothetical protein